MSPFRQRARGIFLLALVALLPSFFSACKSRDQNTLVVGMDLSYPPFETIDSSGKPQGVSVDLAEALGKFLGKPVRIENLSLIHI